jgi:hypothetical protein
MNTDIAFEPFCEEQCQEAELDLQAGAAEPTEEQSAGAAHPLAKLPSRRTLLAVAASVVAQIGLIPRAHADCCDNCQDSCQNCEGLCEDPSQVCSEGCYEGCGESSCDPYYEWVNCGDPYAQYYCSEASEYYCSLYCIEFWEYYS